MWRWKIKRKETRVLICSTMDLKSGIPGKWEHGYLTADVMREVFKQIEPKEDNNFIDLCEKETWCGARKYYQIEHRSNLLDFIESILTYDTLEFYLNEDNDLEIHEHHSHDGSSIHRIRRVVDLGKIDYFKIVKYRAMFYEGIFPNECTESLGDEINLYMTSEMLESALAKCIEESIATIRIMKGEDKHE